MAEEERCAVCGQMHVPDGRHYRVPSETPAEGLTDPEVETLRSLLGALGEVARAEAKRYNDTMKGEHLVGPIESESLKSLARTTEVDMEGPVVWSLRPIEVDMEPDELTQVPMRPVEESSSVPDAPHWVAFSDEGDEFCSTYCEHNAKGACDCQPCTFIRTQTGFRHADDCAHDPRDAQAWADERVEKDGDLRKSIFPPDVVTHAYRMLPSEMRPEEERAIREVAEIIAGAFVPYGPDFTTALTILRSLRRPNSLARKWLLRPYTAAELEELARP